jgi:CRP/FNR family transcriptional regulator, cyclic AMP receptor protein
MVNLVKQRARMTLSLQSAQLGLLSQPKLRQTLSEKSNLIEATSWADGFTFAQVQKLAAYVDVYQVPAETVLFYEGDKNAFLVLIVKGSVHVVKIDSQRKPKHITTVGAGRTIGEMSLIDGEPRSASAVTATDALLLVITAEKFTRLRQTLPAVAMVLVLKIAKLMSQYLRQTSGRLIDNLNN